MKHLRKLALLLAAAALCSAALSSTEAKLLEPITAGLLKAHVAFLASDALEGRGTPSRGLDAAAEYLAGQFRRLGLEPLAGGRYFQAAAYEVIRQPMEGFRCEMEWAGGRYATQPDRAVAVAAGPAVIDGAELVKIEWSRADAPLPSRGQVAGKAVLLLPGPVRGRALVERREALLALGPVAVVMAGMTFRERTRLVERSPNAGSPPPVVTLSDPGFARAAAQFNGSGRLSLRIPAPVREPVELRNVIGVLEGSDPALKREYILLTAHYDHTGMLDQGEGDRINNGANDNASGTATVLALAEAFARAPRRPKRTLVFLLYFGEERGLLGSRYYARSPVFPLARTVANVNFEQMGRTDDAGGSRTGKITATGFDYTTLGALLEAAGRDSGVEAWKDMTASDAFFPRSDNQALADAGVPAITVAVAWTFPDYHRPGDEWQKLDYANMERAVRTCALTVWRAAEGEAPPRWIESNPRTARYVRVWKEMRGMH